MPKFVLAYHGKPDITSPQEGQNHMQRWIAWRDGLGEAVVDPGVPVGRSVTVTPTEVLDHGGSNPLSGITILQADTMEDAVAMAQGCPHLSGSGTIEIAEAMDMSN